MNYETTLYKPQDEKNIHSILFILSKRERERRTGKISSSYYTVFLLFLSLSLCVALAFVRHFYNLFLATLHTHLCMNVYVNPFPAFCQRRVHTARPSSFRRGCVSTFSSFFYICVDIFLIFSQRRNAAIYYVYKNEYQIDLPAKSFWGFQIKRKEIRSSSPSLSFEFLCAHKPRPPDKFRTPFLHGSPVSMQMTHTPEPRRSREGKKEKRV